jgi:hypothetical protein
MVEKYIVLVGTVNSPCNIAFKYIIEENSKYKVLCYLDSLNKGKIVDGVPVISLEEIKNYIEKLNIEKEKLEFYFLFPINTDSRKQLVNILKTKFRKFFKYKTYRDILEIHKENICNFIEKFDVLNNILDLIKNNKDLFNNLKTFRQGNDISSPEFINILKSCKKK